ncbi:MAG TPA: thiamine pyrophosphate-binding protein [Elusimicrobia bacterium]|nr:thiamine pyrophosphate-binding protein [Elusimicrobiota bacterium]
MIKLSDYVMNFLSGLKVGNIFLLPGGGAMHLVDSLGRNRALSYTGCLHEQAAVIAADAYAQYKGTLGVALVTTGPGGTNAITGVAASWIDSTPLLVLSGQAKRCDLIGSSGLRQRGIQEADIIAIVKSVTKYAVTVMDPYSIRYHLEKAVFLACSGRRGPVWLDIPLDVQGAKIDEKKLKGFKSPKPAAKERNQARAAAVRAIELLNKAERPVILAGAGIRMAGALEDFRALAAGLKLPVLTTWRAADFLAEDCPFYFGRPGSIAGRGANFIQQNSDLIITVGARLDLPQVGHNYGLFARGAKKVVVDIDPREIAKLNMRVDVKAVCDAKLFISEFIKNAGGVKEKNRSPWLSRCAYWKATYPVGMNVPSGQNTRVNTYSLIDVLSRLMNSGDILVPGSSGSCAEITMQAFRVTSGQRILNTPGLGSMGFGLPASIGACIAGGGKRTVSVIGDGGLQHNIQELETIHRLKLPVKIFVLSNNGYSSIRLMQARHFNGNYVCCGPSSGLTVPDTVKVASAYGLKTYRIHNSRRLAADVKKVLEMQGPVICEVMVDPDLETAPRLSSAVRQDGSIVSKPLEDLWPFLDREEFASNMIVKPLEES